MRISVFFDHILQAKEQSGKALEELLAGVRRSGVEAVEIRLEYLLAHEEALEKLRQADLGVSCIYEFYEMGLHKEEEKADRHIAAALQAGAARVLVVPGFLHGLEAKQMQWRMKSPKKLERWLSKNRKIAGMVDGLSYIADLGAKEGVVVTVEDFDDKNSPLSGRYGIRWFLEKVPQLRYTLDTGNYLFYEENVLEAWTLLKDKVAHVHCKDRNPGDMASVQVGEGCMPIRQIIKALGKQGYEGYLAIEHFDVSGQEECMEKSAKFLQSLL